MGSIFPNYIGTSQKIFNSYFPLIINNMFSYKILFFILFLRNCDAECGKKGWEEIENTIQKGIDDLGDSTVINNDDSTFDEVLEKTNSEMEMFNAAIQEKFENVCNGKDKESDEKMLQEKLQKVFTAKLSELSSLLSELGGDIEHPTIDRMIPFKDTRLEVQDRSSNAMHCPFEKSPLDASNLKELTWNCEQCWDYTEETACSGFAGPLGEGIIEASCLIHDMCYQSPGWTKWKCEDQFLENIRAQCREFYGRWPAFLGIWPCYGSASILYVSTELEVFHDAYDNSNRNCFRFSGIFALRNRWSGKVITYHIGTEDFLTVKTKNGNKNQLWYKTDISDDGWFAIRSLQDTDRKVIEMYSSSGLLKLTSWTGSNSQKWKQNLDGSIENKLHSKRIYVPNADSGTVVVAGGFTGDLNKGRWSMIYPSEGGRSPYFP